MFIRPQTSLLFFASSAPIPCFIGQCFLSFLFWFASNPKLNGPHQIVDPIFDPAFDLLRFLRSMLSLSPKVFEFFFVYPSDFLSEVDHIVGEGLKDVCLHVRPNDATNPSDLRWLPCSSYSSLVQFVAVVFVAISSAAGSDVEKGGAGPLSLVAPSLPQWLKDDFSALRVEFQRRGGRQERAFYLLKRSCHEHATARCIDPLMLDRLLMPLIGTAASCEGSKPKVADVIAKYNASVYYKEKLIVKEHVVGVQVALRDQTRWGP